MSNICDTNRLVSGDSLVGDSDYLDTLEENIKEVLNQKYDETVEDVDDQLHELQKQLYINGNEKKNTNN